MEIIKASNSNMTKKEIFKMTQNSSNISLKDTEDITINLSGWVLYSDTNSSGNETELLSIIDDQGLVYVTNSQTFRDSFMKMVDFCDDDPVSVIKVIHGKSKNGRNFVDCELVG